MSPASYRTAPPRRRMLAISARPANRGLHGDGDGEGDADAEGAGDGEGEPPAPVPPPLPLASDWACLISASACLISLWYVPRSPWRSAAFALAKCCTAS